LRWEGWVIGEALVCKVGAVRDISLAK